MERQETNTRKDDSRKCEEAEGYERLGRAASMGGRGEDALVRQR